MTLLYIQCDGLLFENNEWMGDFSRQARKLPKNNVSIASPFLFCFLAVKTSPGLVLNHCLSPVFIFCNWGPARAHVVFVLDLTVGISCIMYFSMTKPKPHPLVWRTDLQHSEHTGICTQARTRQLLRKRQIQFQIEYSGAFSPSSNRHSTFKVC